MAKLYNRLQFPVRSSKSWLGVLQYIFIDSSKGKELSWVRIL